MALPSVPILRRARSAAKRLAGRLGPHPSAAAAAASTFRFDDERATHEPFAGFADLRRQGEVHFLPGYGHWIVLGHDLVKEALARPDCFSSSPQAQVDAVLLGADPPRHDPARRLVASVLTGAATAGAVARVRLDADRLIRSQFDLVGDFAVPLARGAAARTVGLDDDELDAVLGAPDISLPAAAISTESRALLERSRLFGELLGEGKGTLDEAAAVSLVRLMCRAATETTERLIVRAGAAWLEGKDLRGRIGSDPAAMGAFIEEVARLYPPEPNVVRRTTRDAFLGGVRIPAQAHVYLSLLAANRDPRRFAEPDRIRLDRGRPVHLAFSGGPHQCIGAGLGRQVTAAALACLVEHGVRALHPGGSADLAVAQGIATPRRLAVTA